MKWFQISLFIIILLVITCSAGLIKTEGTGRETENNFYDHLD